MPPLPTIPDGIQVVVHGTAPSSQTWENVFAIKTSVELNQTNADYWCGLFFDFYNAFAQSEQFTWDGCTFTDLRTVGGPQIDSVAGGFPFSGPNTSQPLPLQTAALISWRTTSRTAHGRGRTYLTGFTESDSTGSHIHTDTHTEIDAAADALITAFGGALAVLSRYETDYGPPKQTVPRDPGVAYATLTQVTHDLWKTQRRRAPRG